MYFSPSQLNFFDNPAFPDCKEVSNELHNAVMDVVASGGSIGIDENNDPVGIQPPEAPPLSNNELFNLRLATCNSDYEQAVAFLRGTYPFSETTTWPVQLEQATEYDAWRQAGRIGDPPATPFLMDLTSERDELGVGSGLEDLVDRVLANNALYSPNMSRLMAIRHSVELRLTTALMNEDRAALESVTWSFAPETQPA